mmetsp:Transcript_13891/g.38431  ORF Transcript_13891/g.38431 Transcript_13891/m.38431 type:complete len:206 (-) Transcript_13891:52-669(-)
MTQGVKGFELQVLRQGFQIADHGRNVNGFCRWCRRCSGSRNRSCVVVVVFRLPAPHRVVQDNGPIRHEVHNGLQIQVRQQGTARHAHQGRLMIVILVSSSSSRSAPQIARSKDDVVQRATTGRQSNRSTRAHHARHAQGRRMPGGQRSSGFGRRSSSRTETVIPPSPRRRRQVVVAAVMVILVSIIIIIVSILFPSLSSTEIFGR